MASTDPTRGVHRQLETALRAGSVAGRTDADLLARFNARPGAPDGEAAFAALVERHGTMVLRACRRLVLDEGDAQEAAQATFLVLARRAGALGRVESVGGWLHGVATRVASKARIAAIRRRARERRGGELAATRMHERQASADPERWVELHEELGRLPEKFRTPLVLCYLEGFTQEQAAAQLQWPLGTVQSRLARGRDRLRSRLSARGAAPSVGLLDVGTGMGVIPPAPIAWVEATTRAAIQFTTLGSQAVRGGLGLTSVTLASEVLRAMSLKKLPITLAAILAATAAVAIGATSWARFVPPDDPQAVSQTATAPPAEPRPQPSAPPEFRIITGVVRDEAGQPLAKAWVGSEPRPMMDTWENPRTGDIRERAEPFRDAQGAIVPPGALGRYFEVRDRKGGPWHPVSPDDINPFEPHLFNSEGAIPQEEVAKRYSSYNVRVEKGGWWMAKLPDQQDATRTDSEGRFTLKLPFNGAGWQKLHFASGDYSLQAIHQIQATDPEAPLNVTLRPTRLVRARLIELPYDEPKAFVNWTAYAVDADGKPGAEWQQWSLPNINNHDPAHVKRRLEVRLPVGRWKVLFESITLNQVVDVEVPPGPEPLDLPDFRLLSRSTTRMVGNPAAEIDAVGLDGKPVHLSDFRGKVVVLDFWANWCGPCVMAMPRLKAIQERFRNMPLAILAIHDASVADPPAYRAAVEPIRAEFWGRADLPFTVLLDQVPTASGSRPFGPKPGDKGSGKTADTYDISTWPTTFLIAADGKFVGRQFDLKTLESALDDQFGLPHVLPIPIARRDPLEPRRNVQVRGRVVGPGGRGVGRASLWPQLAVVRQKDLTTDPNGDFAFEAEQILSDHYFLRVEPPAGLANQVFQIDASGSIAEPLKLGVGVDVSGRVVRAGKPVVGLTLGLSQIVANRHNDSFLGFPETKTDAQGRFHFANTFPNQELVVSDQLGSLKNGDALDPRSFLAGPDGSVVDLGDLVVQAGHKIAGTVVFSDGKAIPTGTKLLASIENGSGSTAVPVDPPSGRFEVGGLPTAEVHLTVQFPDNRSWLPPGYRLSPAMKCVSPLSNYSIQGWIDRDLADFLIRFEPGPEPRSTLDPGRLADFEEAKASTITGAPPSVGPAK